MKKLINGVDNVVDEMLRGMAAAHPESDPDMSPLTADSLERECLTAL